LSDFLFYVFILFYLIFFTFLFKKKIVFVFVMACMYYTNRLERGYARFDDSFGRLTPVEEKRREKGDMY